MRLVLPLLPFALLVACAEPEPTVPDLRARQEAACTAVIAEHIDRPAAEVRSRWVAESGGVASVEAVDGDRRHLCDVDGSGRVLRYAHPRG
ncbi:hypothetical protein KTN05_11475 [Paracoccus sp. Z118]|uniref:hypothetical protein n=1 Tax=Paracoccus sp. Z118 TaxID=2851017 RepID=UPI001C2CA7FF|nr:hypothetical protein [Paracoccus sp. Z118]MBV0892471.1 hypothetical protein [Paracoccus sp. Z118]